MNPSLKTEEKSIGLFSNINLLNSLRKIYKIYFIALEPIYNQIFFGTPSQDLKEKLIKRFKSEEIIEQHIKGGILDDEMIEFLASSFLDSKINTHTH